MADGLMAATQWLALPLSSRASRGIFCTVIVASRRRSR